MSVMLDKYRVGKVASSAGHEADYIIFFLYGIIALKKGQFCIKFCNLQTIAHLHQHTKVQGSL